MQTGYFNDETFGYLYPFDVEGYHLVRGSLDGHFYFSWDIQYSFQGPPNVPLDPPARVVTQGYGTVELYFDGAPQRPAQATQCEFLIDQTSEIDLQYCWGSGEFHFPAGDLTIGIGNAGIYAWSWCEPGVPDVPCSADTWGRPIVSGDFTLTYEFEEDFPGPVVPEPDSSSLLLLPLALIVVAVHRRLV